MATKKRGSQYSANSGLNFRPAAAEASRWELKGTKPLPERSSIGGVILVMVLHLCRKIMFFDTLKRVAVYCGCLFVISLFADIAPIPKSYFSRTDNFVNVYFVKLGWFWTLITATPFVVLSSFTLCCGRRPQVIRHLSRLAIATSVWFFCTSLFVYVEAGVGRCRIDGGRVRTDLTTKKLCVAKGFDWQSFDISGHTFILIYSSLVLIEEARAIIGWERIRDLIREEDHLRSTDDTNVSSALGNLSENDFTFLKLHYEKLTPYVRGLFILMTLFCFLWDSMLLATMLYFHSMTEKFLSGLMACFMWYVTYQGWFSMPNSVPGLPGDGLFKYKETKSTSESFVRKRRATLTNLPSKGQVPTFMGRPLTALRNQDNDKKDSYNGSTPGSEDH